MAFFKNVTETDRVIGPPRFPETFTIAPGDVVEGVGDLGVILSRWKAFEEVEGPAKKKRGRKKKAEE